MPSFVRSISPWFAVVLLAGGSAMLLILLHSLRHTTNHAASDDIASTNKSRWLHDPVDTPKTEHAAVPTPAETPLAQKILHPITTIQHDLGSPYSGAKKPDEAARAARARLLAAYQAPIEVKTDMDNVRVVPSKTEQSPQPIALTAAPPHTLTAGSFFYAVLETPLNSDLPGNVVGRISQNVMDTTSQSELLIPQGTTILGSYSDQVDTTQQRINVKWERLTFPNGAEMALPQLDGMDEEGYTGFADQIDRHAARTWGPAVLMSAIAAGTALSTTPTYGSSQGYSGESMALNTGTNRMAQQADTQLATKLMMQKPTITIRSGYIFRILLTRDLTFASPYQP